MALSKNLDRYTDVHHWLQAALANPNGGTVVMKSKNAAIQWRQRAYYYRKLFAAEMHDVYLHGTDEQKMMVGKSPWDHLVLTVEDNKVHIRPMGDEVLEFIPADGIMPEAQVSPTALLDMATGSAAPMVVSESSLDFQSPVGFTEADAERARKAVADLMKE